MNSIRSARFNQLASLTEGLVIAAQATVAATKKLQREKRRSPRGAVPVPGNDTPLWNELVAVAQNFLQKRGEKVKLARILGISRQRLHVLLVTKTATPDAERTLQLLAWVDARQRGLQPG